MENIKADCDRISSPQTEGGGIMATINISRFIETALKERTTVYSPLVEAIVNSIEAIFETKRADGKIIVTPQRSSQMALDTEALPDIVGFTVEDNGVGFNKKNRDAFDELCTAYKIEQGGKGLGRFIFLKYFKKVRISSIYKENSKYHLRQFNLGSKNEIIENEEGKEIEASDTKTILFLEELKQPSYDKQLDTVARRILERILVFFVNEKFVCPTILLREGDTEIVLNDLLNKNQEIRHVKTEDFPLLGFKTSEQEGHSNDFRIKIYKITYPGTMTSKIFLTANGRQVTETSLSKYIPEFKEDFYEDIDGENRNYRIVAYVLGEYLDKNVSLERGRFDFHTEQGDALYPLSQQAIEKQSANIIEKVFKDQVLPRREKRKDAFRKYVDESAPWNKTYLEELDLSTISGDLDEETMETALQQIRFRKEKLAKSELKKIIEDPKLELFAKSRELVKSVQQAGINDLVHHVALRKIVLELLKKLLEIKDDGKYSKEDEVHNLIFPMKSDSETTNYSEHNLWILDEKLNFTELITSDKAIDKKDEDRPDLLIYDKKMAYRSDNEKSNPITIFEFKKPGRYDFINLSTKEDPIEQIKRYAIEIRHKKYLTPRGREIQVDDNTPFYGYLICDFNEDVRNWLWESKGLIPMSDGMGYFHWFDTIRLYLEVLTWDKLLKDSEQRNKIFFRKLGLIQ